MWDFNLKKKHLKRSNKHRNAQTQILDLDVYFVMMPTAPFHIIFVLCMVWELCEPAFVFASPSAQMSHSWTNSGSCRYLYYSHSWMQPENSHAVKTIKIILLLSVMNAATCSSLGQFKNAVQQ